MRRYFFILGCAIAAWMTSCDSLLEVEPKGNVQGDIFNNEVNIQRALNGAYFNIGGINDGVDGGEMFGGDFILMPSLLIVENVFEVNWDDINGPAYSDFSERNVLNVNARVESNWRRAYETINTLNSILQNIENVADQTSRNRIEGEALAMRGILYFEMARLWGPEYSTVGIPTLDQPAVPLLLEPVEVPGASPALNTVAEVYTQVLADLNEASTLLQPFGTNDDRLSYYAVQGYLMRVAMHTGDFNAAITHATNIVSSMEFSLAAAPQDAFNNTTNSTEDIFAIQQTAAFNSGNINTGTGAVNYFSSLNGQGLGAFRVSPFYLNNLFGDFDFSPEFSPSDLRGTIDESVGSSTNADQVTAAFYTNLLNEATLSPSKFMASDRVIPVIRYAEVLLTRAEAYNQVNFLTIDPIALSDYNAIRSRAGLPTYLETDFADAFAFSDSVLLERRREFLYEGILFHDYKRYGDQIEINGIPITDSRFILPVPQSELDAGN